MTLDISRARAGDVLGTPTAAPDESKQRFLFVDALRGLAALWVAAFHFHAALSPGGQNPSWGSALNGLLLYGGAGVEIFFVISGFVIAASLHGAKVNGPLIGKFLARRWLRLTPTYWTVIALSLLAIVVARPLGGSLSLPDARTVLITMFYLQDILNVHSVVSVAWTLCLVVQFYLTFVALMYVLHRVTGDAARNPWRFLIFAPLAVYSALVHLGIVHFEIHSWFVPLWFLFFMGVLAWWTLTGRTSRLWLFGYLVLCSAPLVVTFDVRTAAGVATCLTLYGVGRLGMLSRLLRHGWLQYFGRISFSFYLVHSLVGSRLLRYMTRGETEPLPPLEALALFALAMLLSIVAAHLLYRLVERPTHAFSKRFGWETEPPQIARVAWASSASRRDPAAIIRAAATAALQWVRELATFVGTHKLWTLVMLAFIAVWTTELWIVQRITLVPPQVIGPRLAFWAPKLRLLMDILFVSTVVMAVRRPWLVMVSILVFFAHLGLITYHHYFLRPLSVLTLLNSWREGREIGKFALDLFPLNPAVLLALALAVKMCLLVAARRNELPRRIAFVLGCIFVALYMGMTNFANRVDPLDTIRTTRGVGRLGLIRGYTGPWLAEIYYLGDKAILDRALALRRVVKDRLTPIEADIPIRRHLVIVQCESLDYNVLGYLAAGQEVTPFLNKLREVSMFYRVRAAHFTGSADADFTVLNGVPGSPHIITYNIPNYPYENTLPQFLSQYGFRTYALHGYIGRFYNRRHAYEQMGFADFYFQEELEERFDLKVDLLGIRDPDVLRISSQLLREAKGRVCHHIITLTSHAPYTFLRPADQQIYQNPKGPVERYVNHARFLDNSLRDYVASLPGDSTVVLYSDHPTEVADSRFKPDRQGPIEHIPCFIYDSRLNLAKMQKTRSHPLVKSGELHLLDVVTYLREQVRRNYGESADEKARPAETVAPPPRKKTG